MRPYAAAIPWMLAAAALAEQPLGESQAKLGAGQVGPVKEMHLAIVPAPPVVDGRLDEPWWSQVPAVEDFVELAPKEGARPAFASRVLLARDATSLYVGARLKDPNPAAISRQLARRDSEPAADWFAVALDGYHDRRTAQVFQVNAAGVQRDYLLYNDAQGDTRWDAVWKSAVRIDEDGWTVEMAIPFSQLRFDPDSRRWGVQFVRLVYREQEVSAWTRMSLDSGVMVSRFGDLALTESPEARSSLELRPYAAAGGSGYPAEPGDPFRKGLDGKLSAGADVKYSLGTSWFLNATVNPDFGQVEADPAQVNLTGQQLFYPEQRPFFLEGVDLFAPAASVGNWDIAEPAPNLFYSRRIGASPRAEPDWPSGAQYADRPGLTPIYGAVKLTGRTPGGLSLGVLDAVTAPVSERYAGLDGSPAGSPQVVEPMTHYLVARGQQEFGDAKAPSSVGLLATAVNRRLAEGPRDAFPSQAYAGGLDWNLRVLGGNYFVAGRLVGSRVDGTRVVIEGLQENFERYAQRPDARHLGVDPDATSLQGLSGQLQFGRIGDAHLNFDVGARFTSPFFEANDLGFQNRADEITLTGKVQWQDKEAGPLLRQWSAWLGGAGLASFGGDILQPRFGMDWSALTSNFLPVNVHFFGYLPGQDDRMLRGGPSAQGVLDVGLSGSIGTDVRRKIRAQLYGNLGGSTAGGRDYILGANVVAEPLPSLSMSLNPFVYFGRKDAQYVDAYADPSAADTYGKRYLSSQLDQISSFVEARAEWTFSPDLSLQTFARAAVISGEFSRYRFFAKPRTRTFVDPIAQPVLAGGNYTIQAPGSSLAYQFEDPDFLYSALQANAVLRWEYRPGSTLFLVYQLSCDATRGQGKFDPGAYLHACGDSAPSSTVMAKLTYWLNV